MEAIGITMNGLRKFIGNSATQKIDTLQKYVADATSLAQSNFPRFDTLRKHTVAHRSSTCLT
eukprot:m.319726 g.319726  ORF g.319726 m.319726 type:complete len:62 (+) comp20306_c0_seq4:4555-4740(+)